ncbi:HAMP domain-containing histidine kinase [Clostridium botulinum]|uniref:HAMP domain-containing sensor histidine kinase n=1 Tax=Clostridium botulinum TaxID=1491 RepID=UPI0001F851F8|nr:HAMP domain-containing sensor histidine kinase [Clostridium botulinum]NFB17929.1 HAMP domain-containing histidine kinase [Clostridium botulinum]NFB68056.1 HAMP domain-containing histidine kinase [Clostridium botulinum]NFB98902.1 HAMP domain-containing histidine kinase [Clostridium botulinum]NFC48242.1 HAMP domain-containing histidine kinase [Clostridium botulinum]NFC59633.1 HAMP domain-containing histidine kinase [Clostridium botulinum]
MKIRFGLKFKMIVTFLICSYASMIISGVIIDLLMSNKVNYTSDISYANVKFIKALEKVPKKSNEINKVIGNYEKKYKENNLKIYIVNNKGHVLYNGGNSSEKVIDLQPFIDKQITLQDEIRYDGNGKGVDYSKISAIKVNGEILNVLVKGSTNLNNKYHVIDRSSGSIGSLLMIIILIIILSFITRPKLKYIKEICNALNKMARGDLKYRIKEKGKDELQLIAFNVNNMAKELERKIENERNIEKAKQDLITNVAHDLRTPLTNIIGYIEIVREGSYKNENELLKYINIISNKAEGLRKLTNDLFMYTKLSSGSVNLSINEFSINELIKQLIDEYIDLFESNDLKIKEDLISESVLINGDADKIARIFDNLFTNAIKYSIKPSDINLRLTKKGENVIVSISNHCDNLEEEDINNLFERFYMADKSRSDNKNSSGLGLAISRTIAELHHGKLTGEYKNGVITFVLEVPV